ncbi:MAG TPA: maleylpyruvate isomerase family mycothiol-dependent enzyme [Acidimicrobiales bacterium]|nr:maleylpyruvate isomerase family mycothiol-dependent enzyme [Acidimicrobiales bacterium]
MDHLEHCDALADEIARFADTLGETPLSTPVTSCPGWTVADLSEHLGTVHRWAEHLVRVQAPERIPSNTMGLSHGPVSAQWMRQGGLTLGSTLRASDPDAAMWAWGDDQHVRFWSRRQLHETLVHRMDLELSIGATPTSSPVIATDAIDEFLVNLSRAAYFSPRVRDIRGDGERLKLSTTDQKSTWMIEFQPDGFNLVEGDGQPTAELIGGSTELLLLLYRRVPRTDSSVKVRGDTGLVDFWLDHSALE